MSTDILPRDFYVYAHRRATTGDIFYIGKGNLGRAYCKSGRSKYWTNIAKKHGYTVEIVQDGLQEWAAFEVERELIALHGRKDCGLGTLINATDGGDGVSGRLLDDSAKRKISKAHTGKRLTDDHKKKLSLAKIGKSKPMHVRKKTSETKRKKSMKIICIEAGLTFDAGCCAQEWLQKSKGVLGARSAIYACCKMQRPTAYGYTWRYA